MQTLRTVIVEDDHRYRDSLEDLLRVSPGLALAGSFGTAEDFLQAARQVASAGPPPLWDICLLDIELPGLDGIAATRAIKELLPGVPVIILTVFEEPATIVAAIAAGADGYLLKRSSPAELTALLSSVAAGGAPLTPAVAKTVLSMVRSGLPVMTTGAQAPRIDLTARERDVLAALVRGLSYKQVGHELDISMDTVRSFIRTIYKKLQVHSVSEAVVKALREGMA